MNWIEVNKCEKEEWNKMWKLYEDSFPENEKRPLDLQEKAVEDDSYHCVGIWEEKQIIAILMYWEWDDCCYVEHFAVNGDLRGQQFGSLILKELCEKEGTVVLEIEPPEDEMTKRRLHFYERLGFIKTNHEHYQIPFRTKEDIIPLTILSYPHEISKKEYDKFHDFINEKVIKYCRDVK